GIRDDLVTGVQTCALPISVAAQVESARELLGAEQAGDEVWAEAGERQLRARGRLSFAPGALADVLAGLDDAIVRVSAGVGYVPRSEERRVGKGGGGRGARG